VTNITRYYLRHHLHRVIKCRRHLWPKPPETFERKLSPFWLKEPLRVDLNPRISKICASWMSVWNISANYVMVPLKFNLNWNIWKPFLKSSPLDFSGQRLGNTSLVVFLRFHSFPLVVKWPEFVRVYITNILISFNVKLAQLTEVCTDFVRSWVHSRSGLLCCDITATLLCVWLSTKIANLTSLTVYGEGTIRSRHLRRDNPPRGPLGYVRFRLKPDTSNSHEFELHRPSNKGTKLLLKVIKAIIIISTQQVCFLLENKH